MQETMTLILNLTNELLFLVIVGEPVIEFWPRLYPVLAFHGDERAVKQDHAFEKREPEIGPQFQLTSGSIQT